MYVAFGRKNCYRGCGIIVLSSAPVCRETAQNGTDFAKRSQSVTELYKTLPPLTLAGVETLRRRGFCRFFLRSALLERLQLRLQRLHPRLSIFQGNLLRLQSLL